MTAGSLLGDILDDDDDDCFLVPPTTKTPLTQVPPVEEKSSPNESTVVEERSLPPCAGDADGDMPERKIRCQYSAQRTQKRKRWADGVLVLREGASSLSLEPADDEGCAVDTIRYTRVVREKLDKAEGSQQELTLDSSRHIIRIDADAWTTVPNNSEASAVLNCSAAPQSDDGVRKCRRRGGSLLLSM
ncbi:hypothetical protein FOZ63_002343 [Perkinsus olseni]|uniref:5'-3' DNA helicase ZGRF1-like N-terminal domain-containing protein n=1 Tax=Perkinsus olseni TaxID=32597 RepID=A0A7J6SRC6_PEROL|nr:hypothetical protein FOZ62_017906 [Perkinsus olseni]KAF4735499.1 hypothetical protein FOZ63_002343 [Perkinsus olseni]